MNVRNIFSALAIAAVAVYSTASAQTYTIGYDQTRYDVDPSETVDVTLFLTEEITGDEVSRLAAGGNNGLFLFSLSVDYSSFTGLNGSTFLSLELNDLFTGGFAGADEAVIVGDGEVSFEGGEDFFENDTDDELGVGGTMIDANTFELELATLTFRAGSPLSITSLVLQPHTDPDANVFTFADDAEPVLNFGAPSQIFVAIPEPGSLTFIAMLAGIGMLKRRRS